MTPIPSAADEFHAWLRVTLAEPADLRLDTADGGRLTVAYLTSLTDKALVQAVLAPLERDRADDNTPPGLPISGRLARTSLDDAIADLLRGFTVIHQAGGRVFSYDTSGGAKRKPSEPTIERTTRGPRVTFVEDLQDNLSLVRQNLQDIALRVGGCSSAGGRGRRSPSSTWMMWPIPASLRRSAAGSAGSTLTASSTAATWNS